MELKELAAQEIEAMRVCVKALQGLRRPARRRVLEWAVSWNKSQPSEVEGDGIAETGRKDGAK